MAKKEFPHNYTISLDELLFNTLTPKERDLLDLVDRGMEKDDIGKVLNLGSESLTCFCRLVAYAGFDFKYY